MNIIIYPNPILKKISENIKISEIEKLKPLIAKMSEIMLTKDGVGLAAPQIGQNIRLIVINKKISETEDHLALINPTITFFSKKKVIIEEGCLSLPDIFLNIERPEKIRISAINTERKKITMKAKGFLARVLQHEVDHLNGILFIDRKAK